MGDPPSSRERAALNAVALVAGVVATALNLRFVLRTGELVAYAPRMTADAQTYVNNAQQMLGDGEWWFTPDTYHSVGASLYFATLLRVFGTVSAMKVVHVVLFAASLALVHHVATRVFESARSAALAVAALGSSLLFARYCAVVQYEVVVAFLFLAMLACASAEAPKPLAIGVLAALAATFRAHFGLVALFYALEAARVARSDLDQRRSHLRRAERTFAGFAIVAFPFNAYYAARTGGFFLFQSASSGTAWLRRLNANASGAMWPYPAPAEPHGFAFVAQEPLLYLRLLFRKLELLAGIVPDVWFVESRWVLALSDVTGLAREQGRTAFGVAFGALTLAGLVSVFATWRGAHAALRLAAMQVVAVLLPQLVVGSSTRVLVPILPAIVLLQLHAVRHALAHALRDQKSV